MVAVQAALIAELRAANAALQAKVVELQAVNQALPQDGLGKPPVATRERRGGGRAPGKQPGAAGAHLA